MSKFLHNAAAAKDDDTKAIAIPWFFSRNSQANKAVFVIGKRRKC